MIIELLHLYLYNSVDISASESDEEDTVIVSNDFSYKVYDINIILTSLIKPTSQYNVNRAVTA